MDIHPIYPKRFVTAYGDLWRIVVIHNSSCNSVATAIGAAGPSGGGHRGNCNKFVEVATLGEITTLIINTLSPKGVATELRKPVL